MAKQQDGTGVIEVHPQAAIYPMLPDDEMEVLAVDIKAHGLRMPIVLDKKGLLIDGRNRLRACEIAEVVPTFVTHDGDALDFIESANLNRRHMTSGQRAMARAMHRPEGEKGGRGKLSGNPESLSGQERNMVSMARKVLSHSTDLARQVLAGAVTLESAFDTAKAATTKAEAESRRMELLGQRAPDLYSLVVEGRLTLEEAEASYNARTSEERSQRSNVIALMAKFIAGVAVLSNVEYYQRFAEEFGDEMVSQARITANDFGKALQECKRYG